MIIGYPGHFDVLLGWILSKLRRKILIWDFFISIYLVMMERNKNDIKPITIQGSRIIEKIALNLSDIIIALTDEYAEWISLNYRIQDDY